MYVRRTMSSPIVIGLIVILCTAFLMGPTKRTDDAMIDMYVDRVRMHVGGIQRELHGALSSMEALRHSMSQSELQAIMTQSPQIRQDVREIGHRCRRINGTLRQSIESLRRLKIALAPHHLHEMQVVEEVLMQQCYTFWLHVASSLKS